MAKMNLMKKQKKELPDAYNHTNARRTQQVPSVLKSVEQRTKTPRMLTTVKETTEPLVNATVSHEMVAETCDRENFLLTWKDVRLVGGVYFCVYNIL
ncbi:hypothetical protein PHYPSEUDO_015523 [Phytophthora pseudosyringae]|uniref:Uncharacterized protein n=1 Tax=Phytophthora pseudosyringae TaxID=221518 RepID=A0A8T1V7Z9_9STRA|nr:hypothetical protein PHYPSEUDO_015523 [Phytophthora pseudosyringae]